MDCLTSEEQNSISEIVFEKIKKEWCKKIDELANLEKEIEVAKANAAQNKFSAEKEVRELRKALGEESQQNADAQTHLLTLKEQVAQQTENSKNANAQINALQQQLQQSNADQEATSERCSSVTAKLESKSKLNEEIKEQLKRLEEQLISAQRSKCEALIKAEEANASQLQIQFKERRYEQEKCVLSRQLEIFQEQLEKRSEEVFSVRRDHSTAIISLQADYNHASEEVRSLREEKDCVVKENNAKAEKIQELLKSLNETRESGAQLDATFKKELSAQQKMTNIYKTQSESQQKHIEKLEAAVEELRQLLQEASEQYGTLEKAKIQTEKEAEQALDEKDVLIKDLKEELSKVNELLKYSARRDDDDMLSEVSPAASAASQLIRKGLTLSQLYTEFLNTSEKLFRAEEENKRMTRYVEQILREIEEKAPYLRKQKEDYERALETINVLHTQIDESIYELEKQKLEATEAQRRSNYLSRENEHFNQQVKDLSKQVAVLLTHVEAARAGLPPPPLPNDEILEKGSASDVIDQHLVTFRDVSELQEQNAKLLASLRDLTDKLESAEKTAVEAKTQELKDELDMAHKELKDLKSSRERMESMVENITRQRDMYRTVLNERSPKTSHSSKHKVDSLSNEDIEKLQSELEKARNNMEKLKKEHEDYKQERNKNEQLERNEMVKLKSLCERTKNENIRLLSQAEYNDERLKTLQSNCEAYQRQVNALEEKSKTLHEIIGRHEGSIDTLRDQIRTLTKKLAQLEVLTANMKEEKTLLKESEARLLAERESLHRSQFSQSLVLNNLEAIKNNLDKHDTETRMRFENKISDLTEENCHLKAKIESNLALKDALSKVTGLEEQLQSTKEELNKSKKALCEAEKNVREFRMQIGEMQCEKSRFGGSSPSLNRNRSVSLLQTSPTTSKSGPVVTQTVKELQLQLAEERSKNAGLQTQLEQIQTNLANLKNVVERQENQIKDNSLSYSAAQDEITSLRKSLEESHLKVKDLEEKLNNATESEKALKETMDSRLMQLTEDLEERENELEEVQKNFEDAKKAEENAREEMKKQTNIAIEMQNKYETEVMLHGADLQAMCALKTKLSDHTSKLEEAASAQLKAEELLSEFRASQEERSKLTEKLQDEMRTRVEELETQNKSLLDQLTKLSDQLSELQSKLFTAPEGVNTSFAEDEARSSEQLLEIIKFLRKEREVADGKVGLLQAESLRLEAQKKCLEDQVTLLNKHLVEEREKNQTSMENAGKYAEMTRKVQTLDALSDSNRILRQEKDTLKNSLEEVEVKISSYESQILPLQEELREVKTKLENVMVEKKTLESEKENYKRRSQELVEKLNKARPEDVIKLQQEVQTLENDKHEKGSEINRLKQTMNTLQVTHKNVVQQKNQVNQKLQHITEENKKLSEEYNKLSVEKVKMQQQNGELMKTNKSQESSILNLQDLLQVDKLKFKENRSQLLQQILEIRLKEEGARREVETWKKNLESKMKEREEMEEKLNEKKKQINILQKQANQLRQVAKKYKSQVESKPGLFEPSAAGDEMEEKMILKTSDSALKKDEPNKLQEQVVKLQNEIQKKDEELNSIKTHDGGYVAKLNADLDVKIQELEKANMTHAQLREKMTSDLVEMSKKLGESQLKQSVCQNRIHLLENEKEQLNQQIENLNKKLSILQKMMDHQKQTTVQKLSPNVISIEKASDPPPTANIKPMAAPVPTPAVSSPRSQGSTQSGSSRSIPTASIRPMAPTSTPVSQTSSSVVLVPPMDTHSGDGAVSSTVTLPQATVTPTPVAPASTATQAFPSTLTATVSPTPVSQSSVASTSPFIQPHHSLVSCLEEPMEAAVAPSPSGSADALISQAIALVAPQVEERSASGQKRKLNVLERDEEEEEEPDDVKRARHQEVEHATEIEAEEIEEMQQEEDMGEPSSSSSHPVEKKDDEILVVSSDEEGQVPSSQSNNVDENQEENVNEGSREAEAEGSEESIIPSSTPSSSLQPPPRPIHEPPSSSSRQSLALFHQLPNYEEGVDDRIVPSTPTLCVSRPCEGASGDCVSSPQVPSQGFEFSSSAEEGPDGAAPSTDGLSQIAEGGIIDVTRMDLAQLDDATHAPAASVPEQSSLTEGNAEGNISSSADDSGAPEEVSQGQSSPSPSPAAAAAAAAPSSDGNGESEDNIDRNDYVVSSQDVVEGEGEGVQGSEEEEEEEEPGLLSQEEEEEEDEEEEGDIEEHERTESAPARETRSTSGIQGRTHAPITWGSGAPSRPTRGLRGQAAYQGIRFQRPRGTPRARRSRPSYK